MKKANLLSWWLRQFSQYISFEERFQPNRLIRYTRGNVIRVNFGFNIGKEMGGLHLAVVLDLDNKRNADVITVIPLSSTDGKEVHPRCVDIGTELYTKITNVQDNLLKSANAELSDLMNTKKSMDEIEKILLSLSEEEILKEGGNQSRLDNMTQLRKKMDEQIKDLELTIKKLEVNKREISRMKQGSMAVINQVTTVSKQRIYTPKSSEDFLYGISLSTSAMEKINAKFKELYVFE